MILLSIFLFVNKKYLFGEHHPNLRWGGFHQIGIKICPMVLPTYSVGIYGYSINLLLGRVKSEHFFEFIENRITPHSVPHPIFDDTKTSRANLFHTPARYAPITPAMMNGDASKRRKPTKIKSTIIKARIDPKIPKNPREIITILSLKVVGIGCPLMVSQFIFILLFLLSAYPLPGWRGERSWGNWRTSKSSVPHQLFQALCGIEHNVSFHS